LITKHRSQEIFEADSALVFSPGIIKARYGIEEATPSDLKKQDGDGFLILSGSRVSFSALSLGIPAITLHRLV
jgi:hypothetical protein